MTAKDTIPTVLDLRPADGTSASIRAAFYRLTDARKANAAEIERLEKSRPHMLLASTTTEIDRADEVVRRRRIFADQMDLLETELRREFTIAKEAEEDAEYDVRLANVTAAAEAWNAEVRAKYPKLAAAVADLMRRAAPIQAAYIEIAAMPARVRKAPNFRSLADLDATLQRGFLDGAASSELLINLVRLPSLAPGAALWPAA